ncbi:hypothetical protein Goari_000618, partial [Gossypium aridum]|nr:hypothetical protein [Gossypium aridum]
MASLSEEIGARVTKKVHSRADDPPDEGGGDAPMEYVAFSIVSFIGMVMNTTHGDNQKNNSWVEEDIKLQEGDVNKEIINGISSIEFSNRVVSLIEK